MKIEKKFNNFFFACIMVGNGEQDGAYKVYDKGEKTSFLKS
jgi:hypothetical protein